MATSGQHKFGRRVSHITQVIGDNLYLWGGGQPKLPHVHNNNQKRRLTSQVEIFNITSGKWDSIPTIGDPPLGIAGYVCTTFKNKIYYFGGWCYHDNCYHNAIFQLDTSTYDWTQLQPTNDRIAVMKRAYGGGVMSTEHDGRHRLLIIGGFGPPPSTQVPQAHYYQLSSGKVSTNEHNLFDILTGQWIIPEITGQCMPPNYHFIIEAVNNTRAIIFGGHVKGTSSNTLYILDIINSTVHWQTIAKPDLVVQWPEKRNSHASSIISGSISPILVVIGGKRLKNTIKDCWILNVNEKSWTKINLPDSVTERCVHSLSTFIMGTHCVWLIIIGGQVKFDEISVEDPNTTVLIELVLNDNQWSVGFVVDTNDLTSTDKHQQRVLKRLTEIRREFIEQEKKLNMRQKEKEAKLVAQPLTNELQQIKDQYHQQLKEQQQQTQELEHQLQECQDEETRQPRDQYQQSYLSLLERLQQSEQARQDLEQQLQQSEQTVITQGQQLRQCQETVLQLEQFRSQHDQPHWVVSKEEFIMTQEVLGGGAYGEVKVAIFRGLRVAAKSLHGIIISDYNQVVFYREMDIAARVRHPNLVQFIGATRVGTPIILTEIMTTSLYKELQRKALTQSQILGISCDVALALNYLHLWKPDPIIHRDISSPNVLLEPSVHDSFKAKVADYGAANLQQQAMTFMPGNPAYASPESKSCDPKSQTPAMDVYSYSVLLMEMILHRPPAMTIAEREQQASRVSWPPLSSIIKRCLEQSHHDRPTMNQILEELKQLKI